MIMFVNKSHELKPSGWTMSELKFYLREHNLHTYIELSLYPEVAQSDVAYTLTISFCLWPIDVELQ